ncbi:MAG: MCE family protein [Bacteroidetes bacterium]|nr:MAG: MCE family protein [Bacteroidota bacterium]
MSRELKTGVIAILIIILVIWGYNFMKNQKVFDNSRTLFAEYQNVQGLVKSSPVTINGLIVGKVEKISFHPSKEGVLVVNINFTDEIEFSTNSVAEIYSPDFISGKSLKIRIAYDDAPIAKNGDTLIGKFDSGILGTINEQIAPLQNKVESFIVNTDTVMYNLNSVLDIENQKNLKLSLKHMSATLANFEKFSKSADKILAANNNKIDSILNNANVAMNSFAQMMDSLEKADLGATVKRLQVTLDGFNKLLDGIEQGNGSIGKLMKDDQLYINLENASKELEELLRDLKMHPKRYVNVSVFGKKEKPYVEEVKE